MPQLRKVSEPLRELTEKNVMFTWDSSQEEAFQAIKNMIRSAPLLKYYDVASETTIQRDASESVWEQLCSKKESWLHLHHGRWALMNASMFK